MPHYTTLSPNPSTAIYVWKITETVLDLQNNLDLSKTSNIRLLNFKSENHKKGFLSVRQLLQIANYTDSDLIYDLSGKPYLKDGKFISITHTVGFSAIVIALQPIGIDVELNRDKILTIAPRFLNTNHLFNMSSIDAIKKATVIWAIKECVFKIENKKGISFLQDITESDFLITNNHTVAQLVFENNIQKYDCYFLFIESHTLVYVLKQN
jgi:phosphopantetheinyl transferase